MKKFFIGLLKWAIQFAIFLGIGYYAYTHPTEVRGIMEKVATKVQPYLPEKMKMTQQVETVTSSLTYNQEGYLVFTMKNEGKEEIDLQFPSGKTYTMKVTDENGNSLSGVVQEEANAPSTIHLKQGEEHTINIPLTINKEKKDMYHFYLTSTAVNERVQGAECILTVN